jgi:hypothetical protein
MTKYKPPFLVFRPKPGTWADQRIAKNSGIVGVIRDGRDPRKRYVLVSFEGNLYGAIGLEKWEQRVMHAADRLATGYPTVARCIVPLDELETVGVVDQDAAGRWFLTRQDGTVTHLSGL